MVTHAAGGEGRDVEAERPQPSWAGGAGEGPPRCVPGALFLSPCGVRASASVSVSSVSLGHFCCSEPMLDGAVIPGSYGVMGRPQPPTPQRSQEGWCRCGRAQGEPSNPRGGSMPFKASRTAGWGRRVFLPGDTQQDLETSLVPPVGAGDVLWVAYPGQPP